ncbi:MAG TPA: ABC transporter permease [Ferrovibrio sp.]|uniref:ABC transporter permease n=1 Tax=Ferrovibrio sp. TaxID=1917215 RepID=UPI002B4B60C3|nr:ABC transporter permease [Ferrovibrio sp.]HLT76774.1 ABC transporter permease [Ferrovibrio sp.]
MSMTEHAAGHLPPPRLIRILRMVGLLRESPVAMIGAGLIVFWIAVAIFAPLLAPFDPNVNLQPFAKPGTPYAAGSGVFWLGTDHLGRDILSRIIWGSQTVLFYGFVATASAYAVGVAMGLAAGYYRGWIDELLSRLGDIILSFPILVLYVVIIATIGASGINIVLAVTFASAPAIMRIVRSLVLEIRERDYVAAAKMRGENAWYIMLVEILPNVRGPLIVDACLRMGYVTITIGVLGFLGLGLPPPDPDWGGMINEARSMALAFPHMTVLPCIAISSLVLGLNLLADGLREISLRD